MTTCISRRGSLLLLLLGGHVHTALSSCSGTAAECGSLYGTSTCSGVSKIKCGNAIAACERNCEQNILLGYDSPCNCVQELIRCDHTGCLETITCKGNPVCEDFKDAWACSVTRGCSWIPPPQEAEPTLAPAPEPGPVNPPVPTETPMGTPAPTEAAEEATPLPITTAPVATPAVTPAPTEAAEEATPSPITTAPVATPAVTPAPTKAAEEATPPPIITAPVATPAVTPAPTKAAEEATPPPVTVETTEPTAIVVPAPTKELTTPAPSIANITASIAPEDPSQSSTDTPNVDALGVLVTPIKTYLIDQGIATKEDLETAGTPQNKALMWMAVEDASQVPVGDTTTPEGYEFLSRYVMATLFYAVNGEGWIFPLEFLTPFPVCEWNSVFLVEPPNGPLELRGVSCDENRNVVTALLMNANNLTETLPAELGLLTTLQSIDVDANQISGSIPDSFQALTDLQNLLASQNQISGQVPSWIGELSNILNINLAFNKLSGTLPASIAKLEEVVGIALDNNLLTGTLEGILDTTEISGLRKLEQFYAEHNQFTGTVDGGFLKDLQSLTYLDISDNFIAGDVPMHLFELPGLLVMDLHDNEFDGLPDAIPGNTNLRMVALHKCQFANQAIPPSIANLNLWHLDLSQNAFTGPIPSEIGSMLSLMYLFLAQNDFSPGPIPSWISGLTVLRELSLKTTRRTGIIPVDLGNLQQLILLDLDNNNLEGEIPASFGSLGGLNILTLNRNNLTGTIPDSFADLNSLKLIYLEANTQLTGSLDDLFCQNPVFLSAPVIVADCDLCIAASDDCCTSCCETGVECNPGFHVPDLDPIWQNGYERTFFTFGREDFFSIEESLNETLTGENVTSTERSTPSTLKKLNNNLRG